MISANPFSGFTREELQEAFTKVQNKENWKLPIKATVKNRDLRKTIVAVEFFCGNGVQVTNMETLNSTIEHPGYYVVIGS